MADLHHLHHLVWLVISKLRLLPFTLPVALFFASAGPIIIFIAS